MPLIHVTTSATVEDGPALQRRLSAELAGQLGKPERYVMTMLQTGVPMTFAGDPAPACYVEVKSIGALDAARTRRLSSVIADLLARHLGVPIDRTYIGFEDVPAWLWGWNGGTFG